MRVTVGYAARDETGEPIEGLATESVTVVIGCGQLLPALEAALDGLRIGEKATVELEPDAAFGGWDPAAVIEIAREELPPEAAPGDVFEAEHESGTTLLLKVLDVRDDSVLLDTNHPLAGQRVLFDLEVLAVRPATEDELEQALCRAGLGTLPAAPDVPLGRLSQRGAGP